MFLARGGSSNTVQSLCLTQQLKNNFNSSICQQYGCSQKTLVASTLRQGEAGGCLAIRGGGGIPGMLQHGTD